MITDNSTYHNRIEAGHILARQVADACADLERPIVVAIPRGGIEVAIPVAHALHAPLECIVSRKIGTPQQSELALGAVDADGVAIIDEELRRALNLSTRQVSELVTAAHGEARNQMRRIHIMQPLKPFLGHDAIIVDDGFATGHTARVAANYLRRHGAHSVTLAVPVGPAGLTDFPPPEIDRVVCPYMPSPLIAVGPHYRHFREVQDATVYRLFAQYALRGDRSDGQASFYQSGGITAGNGGAPCE